MGRLIKPAVPWFYVVWKPPGLSPDGEVAIARLTRREGFFYMLRLHWLLVSKETESGRSYYDFDSLRFFLSQNYPPVLCLFGYWIGLEDCVTLAAIWLATFVYGSARYVAWLLALLHRWPPLAKG